MAQQLDELLDVVHRASIGARARGVYEQALNFETPYQRCLGRIHQRALRARDGLGQARVSVLDHGT